MLKNILTPTCDRKNNFISYTKVVHKVLSVNHDQLSFKCQFLTKVESRTANDGNK